MTSDIEAVGLTRRQYRLRAAWQRFHDAAKSQGACVSDEPQGGWAAYYASMGATDLRVSDR